MSRINILFALALLSAACSGDKSDTANDEPEDSASQDSGELTDVESTWSDIACTGFADAVGPYDQYDPELSLFLPEVTCTDDLFSFDADQAGTTDDGVVVRVLSWDLSTGSFAGGWELTAEEGYTAVLDAATVGFGCEEALAKSFVFVPFQGETIGTVASDTSRGAVDHGGWYAFFETEIYVDLSVDAEVVGAVACNPWTGLGMGPDLMTESVPWDGDSEQWGTEIPVGDLGGSTPDTIMGVLVYDEDGAVIGSYAGGGF